MPGDKMKKILVVEDNEKNMYLIWFILKSDYEVIKAVTGKEGVTLAIQEKPDLILMDIQLPDIDGLEATKRIRKSESGKNIPIIAVTSFAMSGDKERLIKGGCTGHIEKPINLEILLSEMKKYL